MTPADRKYIAEAVLARVPGFEGAWRDDPEASTVHLGNFGNKPTAGFRWVWAPHDRGWWYNSKWSDHRSAQRFGYYTGRGWRERMIEDIVEAAT